jgi:hypothetical protein
MAAYRTHQESNFHPTLAQAKERMRTLHLEAHHERLASRAPVAPGSPIRVRFGTALIAIGSALVAPAARQTSVTD